MSDAVEHPRVGYSEVAQSQDEPSGVSLVEVLLTRLDPDLPIPSYARPDDAGVDLQTTTDVVLGPGERAVVGTGVALALPVGHAGFVHPRSGLAARAGLSVVNTPGTIDAGYRGEIRVCLINHDPREELRLYRGDRIAQLVVQRVERVRFVEVAQLPATERGAGGYGSTGGVSTGGVSTGGVSTGGVSTGGLSGVVM